VLKREQPHASAIMCCSQAACFNLHFDSHDAALRLFAKLVSPSSFTERFSPSSLDELHRVGSSFHVLR
jgi:hypothetical protein